MKTKNELTLKWGTLKGWNFSDEKGKALLKEYGQIGSSYSAMAQNDTPRQKEIICELCDLVDQVYLDWDDKYVSPKEAKEYILNYQR